MTSSGNGKSNRPIIGQNQVYLCPINTHGTSSLYKNLLKDGREILMEYDLKTTIDGRLSSMVHSLQCKRGDTASALLIWRHPKLEFDTKDHVLFHFKIVMMLFVHVTLIHAIFVTFQNFNHHLSYFVLNLKIFL